MKRSSILLLTLMPFALAVATAQESAAPASKHVMVKASAVQWGEAPPAFERGAQAAVIAGDPGKSGLFVLRLKAPPGYRVARHWHSSDEHVTLIEGDLTVEMGEGSIKHSTTLGPGDYLLLLAQMPHSASSSGGAVLQVHGAGPFDLTYVDPKDDPRKRAPAADAKGK
jgi:quercetin dioxygenase-like cupin family protein